MFFYVFLALFHTCLLCEIPIILGYLIPVHWIITHQYVLGIIALSCCLIVTIASAINGSLLSVKTIDIETHLQTSIRLIQLSDIHVGTRSHNFLREVVERTNSLDPDVVVITGDLVDNPHVLPVISPNDKLTVRCHDLLPLAELRAKRGVFFVSGNHDIMVGWDRFFAGIKALGNVTVLENEVHHIPLSPLLPNSPSSSSPSLTPHSPPSSPPPSPLPLEHLTLIGISDGESSHFKSEILRLITTQPSPPKDKNTPRPDVADSLRLILHHRPHKHLCEWAVNSLEADGLLAGHTHAGQMIPLFPLIGLAFHKAYGMSLVKQIQKMGNNSKIDPNPSLSSSSSSSPSFSSPLSISRSSALRSSSPFVYISPGTGTFGAPFRMISRCEITLFNFKGTNNTD